MKRLSILLCVLLVFLCLFAGCTKPEPSVDPNDPGDPGVPGDVNDPDDPGDGAIHVSTVEEFLEAIAPDVTIVIEPGKYDLGKTLAKIWNIEGVNYNLAHAYVTVAEVDDGAELYIIGCDGLTIRGGSSDRAATELITDPRYATVLSIFDSRNVTVENLTAGHTDRGVCSGDVIHLENCRDVTFRNVDLYGCGVVGIRADNSNGILVEDSKIHDCDCGPFWYYRCTGNFDFRNCAFVESNGGGYLESSPDALLAFSHCTFGTWETNEWSYSDRATFDYCSFSEVNAWLGPEGEKFEPDSLRHIPLDADVFNETLWDGFLLENADGRAMTLPHWSSELEQEVQLEFLGDGTGHLYWYNKKSSPFEWTLDSDYSGKLDCSDDRLSGVFSLYTDDRDTDGDGEGAIFLLLQIGDETVWLNRTWY